MKRTFLSSLVLGPALLLGALLLPAAAAAAGPITPSSACTAVGTDVTCNLWAETGSLALPGGATATIWGFSETAGGPATVPGPVLVVDQGDAVTVNLTNNLGQPTSILFDGQAMIPDTTGAAANGGTTSYAFTASEPGTYLYEAGLIPGSQYQVAMGLYGVLVVRPAGTPGQAYADAGTAFDDEALVVLGEIDPALNNGANPATFDMRVFAPRYQLINGVAYSDTAPSITTTGGNALLLRYANAGIEHHSMGVLGLRQSVLAADGSPLTYPRDMAAETIAPGQTADVLVSVPASTAPSTKYALYDAALLLNNNGGQAFGGMLAFVDAAAGAGSPGDTVGPVTSGLTLAETAPGSGIYTLTATVDDTPTGGSNVAAAEYKIDGVTTAMSASDAAFDSPTEAVTSAAGAIDTTLWSSGTHVVYVRGQDALGNWGTFATTSITIGDRSGPATSGLLISPNPSNGGVNVTLTGTASDAASGNSNVTAAEYTIDGGTATPMSGPFNAPTVSISANILGATINGLSDGPHAVAVRARDAAGNWGDPTSITLTVDKTGPTTSSVLAAPNPNNGKLPFNSSTQAVRVTATFNDTASGGSVIAGGEGFIDTVGANGTGFLFVATDGVFNAVSEQAYADIPLATILGLSNGNHTVYVHGRDAAGNWGTTSTTTLVIDKAAPTISSVTLTPSSTIAFGAASVTLNVTASDGAGTGVSGGQYWIDGSATPPANPTAFTGSSATINTSSLAGGIHTVYVRVQDGVTNWSSVSSATLTVIQAVNDARTITANTSATQTSDANAAAGVLTNDQPIGLAGRTAAIATAPIRTSGSGAGTIAISCPGSLGTAATPAVGGNTVCTNGAYRVTLTGVGGSGNARRASKLGTFTFTYTETLNGVTSTATVTITVN